MKQLQHIIWRIAGFHCKQLLLLGVVACILSLMLCTALSGAYQLQKQTSLSNAAAFGVHHVIALRDETGSAQTAVDAQTGTIDCFGACSVSGTTVHFTLGSFDQEAEALASFNLLSGKLPTDACEIAVEQHIADRLPGFHIGQGYSFEAGSRILELRVSGVISDYTSQWNLPERTLQMAQVPLPGGIISQELGDTLPVKWQLNLLQFPSYDVNRMAAAIQAAGFDMYTAAVNSRYYEVCAEEADELRRFCLLFLAAVVVAGLILTERTVRFLLACLELALKRLRVLGAPRFLQCLVVAEPTAVVYSAGAIVGSTLWKLVIRSATAGAPWQIGIAAAVQAGVFAAGAGAALAGHLRKKSSQKNCRGSRLGQIPLRSVARSLGRVQFAVHCKELGGVALALFGIVCVLLGTAVYRELMQPSHDGPDFQLRGHQTEIFQDIGPYRLSFLPAQPLDLEEASRLESAAGVSVALIELDTADEVLRLPGASPSYAAFFHSSPHMASVTSTETCTDYHLLLGTESVMRQICETYGAPSGEVLLFAPGYDGALPDRIQLERVPDGAEYSIGAAYTVQDLHVETETLEVGAAFAEACILRAGDRQIAFGEPVVIVPPELAGGLLRFGSAEIYAADGADLEQLNLLAREFSDQFANPFYYSVYESEQRVARNLDYFETITALLAVVMVAVAIATFAAAAQLSFAARTRSFELLAVAGLGPRSLRQMLWTELSLHAGIFLCAALVATLVVCLLAGASSAWLWVSLYALTIAAVLHVVSSVVASRAAQSVLTFLR